MPKSKELLAVFEAVLAWFEHSILPSVLRAKLSARQNGRNLAVARWSRENEPKVLCFLANISNS
ncbi:MAG: hypothetical protein A3J67_00590 [Parcubacteria group bacterium RIFCSPHIGHO2_02_FULL_48_10b]|nr:MAG: hypothetical protein A3J67_00590 [Parcubacteria group bacterium RIFCSPHIGHO2_02_FULL_48_10b]